MRIEQAIVPSDNTIFGPVKTAKSSTATIYAHVPYAGRYRLKCEIKTNNASVNAIVTVYENSSSNGNIIGYASVKGDVYTPITMDLESVAANSKIVIVLTTSNSSYPATIRNIELCGEYGFQNLELTGI
ncbi:hypothetical protein [Clostridium cochlearium]|uniref:hypothetical protein n=1 Tax=Clostridium cochlearium TaxID=1494 RepID=UPI000BBBBAF7|nr:hypothetical protein [Clostridium cochlearium]